MQSKRYNRILLGNVANELMLSHRVPKHEKPLLDASSRKLWLAEENDIVVSNVRVSNSYKNYVCQHLGIDEKKVLSLYFINNNYKDLSSQLDELGLKDAPITVSPYALDKPLFEFISKNNLKLLEFQHEITSQLLNNIYRLNTKSGFRQAALDLNMRIPDGIFCSGRLEIIEATKKKLSSLESVFLKMNCSSNGYGALKLDQNDLPILEKKINFHLDSIGQQSQDYILEEFINHKESPSVEMVVNDGGAKLSYFCNQFSDGNTGLQSELSGISSHAVKNLKKYGYTYGDYLFKLGYRGVFDLDAIYTDKEDLILTESNVRRTAGTHLHEISTRLLGDNYNNNFVWKSGSFTISTSTTFKKGISRIDSAGINFNPKNKTGILIITDPSLSGIWRYLVIAKSMSEAITLESNLVNIFKENISSPKNYCEHRNTKNNFGF